MPYIIAACGPCAEIKYTSTREYGPTEKLNPLDFEPQNGQAPAALGSPMACTSCGAPLTISAVPPRALNGFGVPNGASRASGPMPVGPSPVVPDPAVRIVFTVEPGEELRSMRDLPNDRILIVTSKRILTVDIEALAIKEMHHA